MKDITKEFSNLSAEQLEKISGGDAQKNVPIITDAFVDGTVKSISTGVPLMVTVDTDAGWTTDAMVPHSLENFVKVGSRVQLGYVRGFRSYCVMYLDD